MVCGEAHRTVMAAVLDELQLAEWPRERAGHSDKLAPALRADQVKGPRSEAVVA